MFLTRKIRLVPRWVEVALVVLMLGVFLAILVPNYLKSIATCPEARRDTYSNAYVRASEGKAYTVLCLGQWHARVGLAANYPQYSSRRGIVVSGEATEASPVSPP